jgi:hypothetical protein
VEVTENAIMAEVAEVANMVITVVVEVATITTAIMIGTGITVISTIRNVSNNLFLLNSKRLALKANLFN